MYSVLCLSFCFKNIYCHWLFFFIGRLLLCRALYIPFFFVLLIFLLLFLSLSLSLSLSLLPSSLSLSRTFSFISYLSSFIFYTLSLSLSLLMFPLSILSFLCFPILSLSHYWFLLSVFFFLLLLFYCAFYLSDLAILPFSLFNSISPKISTKLMETRVQRRYQMPSISDGRINSTDPHLPPRRTLVTRNRS